MTPNPFFYHDAVYPYAIYIFPVNPGAEWPVYCWQVYHTQTLDIISDGVDQSKTNAFALALAVMNRQILEDRKGVN